MPSQQQDTESELLALVGTTVAGKYRVDRLIGRGGMGAVFQAQNLAIGKRVALKFLDREAAQDLEACQRFQREAEAAGMAESAHIVQIFDSGTTEAGLPFLVMELLVGEDLRTRLRRETRLPVTDALGIVAQVLRALVRAHQAGIVHRDLKPDNVFLCTRDDDVELVKIIDFGISKVRTARFADTLTRRGTVLGTASYMSPEQAQSFADIDGRTDLFSVGALLFEMLTGEPPHEGRTYEAVLIAICTREAPDVRNRAPEVPPSVAALVARALQRERARRFQSAEEFLAALAEARSVPGRRYGTLVTGLVATSVGFVLTAYLVLHGRVSSSREPRAASASVSATAPVAVGSVLPSAVSTMRAEPAPPVVASASKPHRLPVPKPSSHVSGVSGLQLSTKEP